MLRDILEALADNLRADIGGALASDDIDIEVEPRFVISPSEGVCLDVFPGAPSRDSAEAGMGDISGAYVIVVRARVTVNENDEMQDLLADMIDDQHELSVAAALVDDQTLNGWANYVDVDPDGFSGVLDFSASALPMVGCAWRVLVGQAVS